MTEAKQVDGGARKASVEGPGQAGAGNAPQSFRGLHFRALRKFAPALIGLAVVIAFPYLASNSSLNITNLALIAIPAAMALTVLSGTGGLISVGHGALIGIGGFSGVILSDLNLPFLVVVVLAGLVGLILGGVIALPSLRIAGFYLMLATLAMAYIASYFMALYQEKAAGGQFQQTGFFLPAAEIGGLSLITEREWYWFLIVFALLVAYFWRRLMVTKTGRAWLAVRHREAVAPLLGINIVTSKIVLFALSSAVVTICGCLAGYHTTLVTSEQFVGISIPISYYAMIVTGGLGTLTGAAIGAVIVTSLPYVLPEVIGWLPDSLPFKSAMMTNSSTIAMLIYGLLIVLFLWLEPKGIVGLLNRARSSLFRKREVKS